MMSNHLDERKPLESILHAIDPSHWWLLKMTQLECCPVGTACVGPYGHILESLEDHSLFRQTKALIPRAWPGWERGPMGCPPRPMALKNPSKLSRSTFTWCLSWS